MLKEKIIVSELIGGLGNQLFNWAAGYSLSQRLNFTHYINSRKSAKHGSYLTDFGIHNIEYPITKNLDFMDLIDKSSSPALNKVSRSLKTSDFSNRVRPYVFEENSFEYNKRIEEISSSKLLRGYFQSWRYFQPHLQEIRSILNSRSKMTSTFEGYNRELCQKKWVAIHVRRKDYVEYSSFHGLTSPVYYKRALGTIELGNSNVVRVVFSDDIELAKEVVKADMYIGELDLSLPSENIKLMSRADFIIGSNSTFSWWAAFMMGDEKLAIFPRPWFATKEKNTRDLLLPNWLTIGNEEI